jgi:hypothetical protein
MTYTGPERTTPRLKVARSRFELLDSLSAHPLTAEINWDGVIPDEDDSFCRVIVTGSKSSVPHFYDVIHPVHSTRTNRQKS